MVDSRSVIFESRSCQIKWSSKVVFFVRLFSQEGGESPSSEVASAVREPWIEFEWVSRYSCQSKVPIWSTADSSRLSTSSELFSGTLAWVSDRGCSPLGSASSA